ncbi:FkbM family methyltransferase [Methylovirgula sp. 4M-Z18]|uniref:FkbM family methyltransferase n=1 Tax=Methylovirgula sp. 4M-Z18 TaxID=2293567 RepID=UPI001314650E|nr:FkbM family methyltransferase [Methylovirgula sp. 4M-Z18]
MFISYAQNYEDVLLARVFGGQGTGFYVDVGAYHPVHGSVTKALYDRDWSGINIEPGPVFEELAAQRPRDINLRMAVMDYKGEVSFVDDTEDGGLSHVDPEASGGRRIPCDTLENIVRDHAKGRPIDFIKIDVEGAEEVIVRSTNWRNLRPRVLIFEATKTWSNILANEAWEPILLEQGYMRVHFDGVNCYYVPEEEHDRLKQHFSAPVNVLDNAMRYDMAPRGMLDDMRAQRDELAARVADEQRTAQSAKEALEGELHTARAVKEALSLEREQFIAAIKHMEHRIARMMTSPNSEPAAQTAPAPPPRRGLLRSLARLVYAPVRPVVRAIARRLRGFLTAEINAQLHDLRLRQDALRREAAALYGGISPEADVRLLRLRDEIVADVQQRLLHERHEILTGVRGKVNGDDELRRLAKEMEVALMTLALDAGHSGSVKAENHNANNNVISSG